MDEKYVFTEISHYEYFFEDLKIFYVFFMSTYGNKIMSPLVFAKLNQIILFLLL